MSEISLIGKILELRREADTLTAQLHLLIPGWSKIDPAPMSSSQERWEDRWRWAMIDLCRMEWR